MSSNCGSSFQYLSEGDRSSQHLWSLYVLNHPLPSLGNRKPHILFPFRTVPLLLQSSTGIPFSTEDLLEIGKENPELQDALQNRFKKLFPVV